MWPQGAPGVKKANFGENALFTFEAQFCKYLHNKVTELLGIFSKLVILGATERLVQGIMQLCFCPYKVGSYDNHHYPSSECGNVSCFGGYSNAPLGCKILENVIHCFPEKK
jgi:hypothetical protein